LAWLAMPNLLATVLLVLLIPVAAVWGGRRVRVVWERGIPRQFEAVPPVRRLPAMPEVAEASGQPPTGPQTPYPLQDPLIELRMLPGGTFWMGSRKAQDRQAYDDEQPRREVKVSPFAIARTAVTRGLYRSVMATTPSQWQGDEDDVALPANYVSWQDAARFCNALSEHSGLTPCYSATKGEWTCDWDADGYRLPTEAEWEYACRADTETPWYWGVKEKDADRHAWYAGNCAYQVRSVREKAPNRWGLYDMAGNVWEWCWDWYGPYNPEDLDNPRGPVKGESRVLRGGSFRGGPGPLRSAGRVGARPGVRDGGVGLRCVRGSVRQLDN